MVKIFLHVSKTSRKNAFERIDNPAKNWKFSASDLAERAYFDDYQRLYEQVIDATAAKEAPWYALPADQKWYTRYLVSEIVVDALEHTSHNYPCFEHRSAAELADCRTRLRPRTADGTHPRLQIMPAMDAGGMETFCDERLPHHRPGQGAVRLFVSLR